MCVWAGSIFVLFLFNIFLRYIVRWLIHFILFFIKKEFFFIIHSSHKKKWKIIFFIQIFFRIEIPVLDLKSTDAFHFLLLLFNALCHLLSLHVKCFFCRCECHGIRFNPMGDFIPHSVERFVQPILNVSFEEKNPTKLLFCFLATKLIDFQYEKKK